MTEVQGFRTDEDLFALARTVLSEAGFAQEKVKLQDTAVLLAENEYCIVALAATPTMDDLVAAEPHLEAYLRKGVEDADIGPKLWDVYVVLLTQEKPSEQGSGLLPLFTINYDTRGFRRIARVGIEATTQGVRNALISFVEPVKLENRELTTAPLVALSDELISYGIEESVATRAVEIYQTGGQLDDAL